VCRGKRVPDFKTKQLIRPDRVFEHFVHYPIANQHGNTKFKTVQPNRWATLQHGQTSGPPLLLVSG
jgi:hypothetical protein